MEKYKENDTYMLRQLSHLLHVGIFAATDNEIISYEENAEYNPLYKNETLRRRLIERVQEQSLPVILAEEQEIYFICIKKETLYYMMGPVCTQNMNRVARHRFYYAYGIKEDWEKGLHYHTTMEMLQMTGLFARLLTGQEYTDQELVDANRLVQVTKEEELHEQVKFKIREEEEDIYRHTYQEERALLNMVREGNVEEAVRLSKEMDIEIGRLGKDELTHWKNLLVVASALCARAAIEGGLSPHVAYRVSGFYINKGSGSKDITQILAYRNRAVEELASRVRKQRERRHSSSYIEQCKDYVQKHFKEKIYLDKAAEALGVSSSYLSRLFRKETGMRFQDYINDVKIERAKNLLLYSEESLAAIAEYINFPSQSYFGKIFRERTGMTPRQFRENYKPIEFTEKKDVRE